YDAVVDRVRVFDGMIEDVRYTQEKITLLLSDNIKYADVTIPKKGNHKTWDRAKAYRVGDLVSHQFFTWKAKLASTGISPETSPAAWQQITFPKVYDVTTNNGTAWHLVDIVLDILRNEINMDDNRINIASFNRLRALRPGYVGNRTLIKPQKAMAMLGELAWLLECQWVQLSEGVSLVPEIRRTDLNYQSVPHINDHDIASGSFSYRRGWKELVNECLIFSQWDGTSYQSATSYADAASISALRVVQQEVGYDKWHMPPAILDGIAQHVVARKNKARRILSFSTGGRCLRLECGDRVSFESSLLPASDPQWLHCVVVKKDMTSWQHQTIKLTLMEIL
ncbi:MAG: hypothetical protein Q9M10_03415, partial [Mariprofundaceae bacterium]|nr:hypothetical protein [Mariprofundaceae bacterium]